MKVAIVYDRVNKWGGAERVLLSLHKLFPDAPLYTSVYQPSFAPWAHVFPKITPSFLQKLPFARSRHHLFSFIMPLVFESFDFDDFDCVISVTSEAAKGIITKPHTLHVCYCLTPTRYLWSGYEVYVSSLFRKVLFHFPIAYLRRWDRIAGNRPDVVVGISRTVTERIAQYYNRRADIIYPPVLVKEYAKSSRTDNKLIDDYYLLVSRLVPYKKVDIAVKAFNQMKKRLVIVGVGSEEKRLRRIAGKTIQFAGHIPEHKLHEYYEHCRALIFPQEEDFGLVSIEAQAAGKPVIAFERGGAQETVTKKTGVFFDTQTPESLQAAVTLFEKRMFMKEDCVSNAKKFSEEHFLKTFGTLISDLTRQHEVRRYKAFN